MALKKVRLGDILIPFKEKCGIPNLTPDEVSGVNRDKEFFEPSHQVGSDTTNYQNVPPHFFACNLMHVGRDVVLPIAYNHTNSVKHVSPAYSVFSLKKDAAVLDEYFFMWLKSDERDRFFWFNTDSSIRDGMSWDDFCDIEIEVPDLTIQRQFVDTYLALCDNQKSYEKSLKDLKLVCDGYIEDLRRKNECEEIGKSIFKEEKNNDEAIDRVLGIGQGGFMKPQKVPNESLRNYKILRDGDIGYAPPLYNVLTGALHCYRDSKPAVCSPIYEVFSCDETKLIPEYLTLWLKREEFKRYASFYALGVRQTFDFDLMQEVKIPIPSLEIQQAIVNIYKCYLERIKINDNLKEKIQFLCPILIRGSIKKATEE